MHRLQISVRRSQLEYLARRARRDGVSVAEIIRRLVESEAQATRSGHAADSLLSIAGIASDREPLIGGVPVSENPALYLTHVDAPPRGRRRGRRPARRDR